MVSPLDLVDEAYVGFYRENDISPVHQDVSDLSRHFSRRSALYASLGLPPIAVRGASVLEVGPGSGHNALYTASLHPARYVLIDANPVAVRDMANLLASESCCSVLLEDVEAVELPEKFDVVLAEGLLPHRRNPTGLARRLGRAVRPGGVMVVTTADYVSVCAEVLRRLVRCALVSPIAPLDEQLAALRPVFGPHYETIANASRPLDDWIADTLVCPWRGELFSIADALAALAPEGFEVYGSSPRFLVDWRWYKDVREVNALALETYENNRLTLLDARETPRPGDAIYAAALCRHLFDEMLAAEVGRPDWESVCRLCQELAAVAPSKTALALYDAAGFFEEPDASPQFEAFTSWFGRGQQYLSFIKR